MCAKYFVKFKAKSYRWVCHFLFCYSAGCFVQLAGRGTGSNRQPNGSHPACCAWLCRLSLFLPGPLPHTPHQRTPSPPPLRRRCRWVTERAAMRMAPSQLQRFVRDSRDAASVEPNVQEQWLEVQGSGD